MIEVVAKRSVNENVDNVAEGKEDLKAESLDEFGENILCQNPFKPFD